MEDYDAEEDNFDDVFDSDIEDIADEESEVEED
jgi:hypothetical protein